METKQTVRRRRATKGGSGCRAISAGDDGSKTTPNVSAGDRPPAQPSKPCVSPICSPMVGSQNVRDRAGKSPSS
jgi:hypothetical protein